MMQGKPCQAPGCTRTVTKGLNVYCPQHARKVYETGAWNGRGLRRYEYLPLIRELRRFVEIHKTHPGILAALRFARQWMADAMTEEDHAIYCPAREEMRRIVEHGTEAKTVVIEALAAWLCIDARPFQFKAQTQVVKAIGNAVLILAPKERRRTVAAWKKGSGGSYRPHKAGSKRDAGQHVIDNLAPLFANIKLALPEARRFAERQKELMYTPFDLDGSGGGDKTD
jgi:hypothetical protein